MNYSLRATPQGWKAWDVTIEGISYVKNYRTDFGAQADKEGIDAVIKRLETQNASGKPDPNLKAAGRGDGLPRPEARPMAAFEIDSAMAPGRLEAAARSVSTAPRRRSWRDWR